MEFEILMEVTGQTFSQECPISKSHIKRIIVKFIL